MIFSRYKCEHVADHIRMAIEQGQLVEPLPSLRDWSSSLGVSSGTLQAALKILKEEGWIGSLPKKGFFLARKPRTIRFQYRPVVRWIWHDPKHRLIPFSADVLMAVSQSLAKHDIDFRMEWCNNSRLLGIYKGGVHRSEMLLFPNLSSLANQKLFAHFKNALLIGLPFKGIDLPYISCDVYSAIRHATYHLLRKGCDRVDLIYPSGRGGPESRQRLADTFEKICANAPRSMFGKVIWLSDEQSEQCLAIKKISKTITGRHGFVLSGQLSPSLFIMVLTNQGFKIPEQVDVVAVNCVSSQINVFPQLAHYPFPLEQFSKAVCRAAIHYFEAGVVPNLQKNIPLHACLAK